MNFFSNFHPAAIFLYFTVILVISIVVFDPVVYFLLFLSQILLYLYLNGAEKGGKFLIKCGVLVLFCVLVNPLVNHRGESVIFFLGGLPVTWECVFYGCMTGLLLAASVLLFGCYNAVMDSEKMMCLFGNLCPRFSLLFSMALRLVPKCKRDYRKIRESHRVQPGILTALVGLALEDSMETGIVMGYRGYSSGRRTSIYDRKMRGRDIALTGSVLLLGAAGCLLYLFSKTRIEIYPRVDYQWDTQGILSYAVLAVLMNLPMMINSLEEWKWNRIVSKI